MVVEIRLLGSRLRPRSVRIMLWLEILNFSCLAILTPLATLFLVLLQLEEIKFFDAAFLSIDALDLDVLKHKLQVLREAVISLLLALGTGHTGRVEMSGQTPSTEYSVALSTHARQVSQFVA